MRGKRSLAADIVSFYEQASLNFELPGHVSVLNPYGDPVVRGVVKSFYEKFYGDSGSRLIVFGINPGRFGAGITGVPFTDPIRLERDCGIANSFQKRAELSSEFVYEVVEAWGGGAAFFQKFFISALSPLGYVSGGRNLNYYDDKLLMERAGPYIVEQVKRQQRMLRSPAVCLCLGEGTNYRYFSKLNAAEKLFSDIIPLPHPRWVMQYRRRQKRDYVDLYIKKLEAALEAC